MKRTMMLAALGLVACGGPPFTAAPGSSNGWVKTGKKGPSETPRREFPTPRGKRHEHVASGRK